MTRKILLIDDSEIALDIIRATLMDFGFDDIVSFMDPQAALTSITSGETSADLILLDIMMPEIDGIELCARIRGLNAWSDVPIIMLTSRKDMESLSQAFVAGANDFVTKPFDRIELQARMRSALRLKAELDRRRAGERRSSAPGRRAPVAALDELAGKSGMVATGTALQLILQIFDKSALDRLGLVCFCIDKLNGASDIAEADKAVTIQAIADVLGQTMLPARDVLGHWSDDLFCLVSLTASEAELVAAANGIIDTVARAGVMFPKTWGRETVTVSAAILPPGVMTSVAAGLADVIMAATRASRSAAGSLTVLSVQTPQEQPS